MSREIRQTLYPVLAPDETGPGLSPWGERLRDGWKTLPDQTGLTMEEAERALNLNSFTATERLLRVREEWRWGWAERAWARMPWWRRAWGRARGLGLWVLLP